MLDGRPPAAKLLYWDSLGTCRALTPPSSLFSPLRTLHQLTGHNRSPPVRSRWANTICPEPLNHPSPPPSLHDTADHASVPVEHFEAGKISSHGSPVRGRGGPMAVLYETRWKGLLRPSWERGSDLLPPTHLRPLERRASTLLKLRQANRAYRRMRVGASQRELAWDKGTRSCLPEIATSTIKHGLADLAVPFVLSAPTSRTLLLVQGSRASLIDRKQNNAHSNP